jgi:hypothetical protein
MVPYVTLPGSPRTSVKNAFCGTSADFGDGERGFATVVAVFEGDLDLRWRWCLCSRSRRLCLSSSRSRSRSRSLSRRLSLSLSLSRLFDRGRRFSRSLSRLLDCDRRCLRSFSFLSDFEGSGADAGAGEGSLRLKLVNFGMMRRGGSYIMLA